MFRSIDRTIRSARKERRKSKRANFRMNRRLAMEPLENRCLLTVLNDSLVYDTLNTFEDQSREAVFDVDGDGAISEGDVAVGFLRLDNRSVPAPPFNLNEPDGLYAVFAIEVDTIDTTDLGAAGSITFATYAPVTNPAAVAAGLDLDTIVGGIPAVNSVGTPIEPGGAMVAVYEGVTPNLIISAPGGAATNLLDFTTHISGFDLDLVLGLGAGATEGDDIWLSRTFAPVGGSPFSDITVHENLPLGSGFTLAEFQAGLSIGCSAIRISPPSTSDGHSVVEW